MYFNDATTVKVQKYGYEESLRIPIAKVEVVVRAISSAVEKGQVWFLAGTTSILGGPIPSGVLNDDSKLYAPPTQFAAVEKSA